MRQNKWSDEIAVVIMMVIFIFVVVIYNYTQRYVENHNATTAKSGIFFTRVITLSNYKVIGSGSGLFGEYSLITRSMTQGKNETTSIYKD